ncbi:MAG: hypothetical protein L0G99_12590 [Propionibacteriales bacterium]|nr:hypothetical protein [Propionibacteriales bacterium]
MPDIGRAHRAGRLLLVLGALLAVGVTLRYGVNGDIRYELGSQWTSMRSPADTFTHRPLMYRLLMSVIALPAEALRRGITSYEMVLRVESIMIVTAASALLWAGVRRRWPDWALPVAVVVAAATLLLSPGITFEPDWLAVPVTVAGVGVALLGRPGGRIGPVVGGVLFAVAAVIKVITLPTAMIGLLVLWRLDRRRCWWSTGAAVVAGIAWIVALATVWPHEIGWFFDSSTIQPDRPPLDRVALTGELIGNAAWLWPVLILFPAAAIRLGRRDGVLALLIMVLAWVPAPVQNQFYIYHVPAVPVVAALALLPILRSRGWQASVAVLTVIGAVLLNTPATWRVDNKVALFVVALLIAGVAAVVQARSIRAVGDRSRRGAAQPVIAASLVVLAALPPNLPGSAWTISMRQTSNTTNVSHARRTADYVEQAEAVRKRIGPTATVTYLTFGDRNYTLRNPTTCRFPTNVFLQRSRTTKKQEGTLAWRENLTCLTEADTDWLVWDKSWFALKGQPPVVLKAIKEKFDCDAGFVQGDLTVCPRRR